MKDEEFFTLLGRMAMAIPHSRRIGLQAVSMGVNQGTMRIPFRDEFISNTNRNRVHSGIVTTLLDTLCGFVAISAFPPGTSVATLDLRIDHLRPIEGGQAIFAEAECYNVSDSVAYVRGMAYLEDKREPLASSMATFMVNGEMDMDLVAKLLDELEAKEAAHA